MHVLIPFAEMMVILRCDSAAAAWALCNAVVSGSKTLDAWRCGVGVVLDAFIECIKIQDSTYGRTVHAVTRGGVSHDDEEPLISYLSERKTKRSLASIALYLFHGNWRAKPLPSVG